MVLIQNTQGTASIKNAVNKDTIHQNEKGSVVNDKAVAKLSTTDNKAKVEVVSAKVAPSKVAPATSKEIKVATQSTKADTKYSNISKPSTTKTQPMVKSNTPVVSGGQTKVSNTVNKSTMTTTDLNDLTQEGVPASVIAKLEACNASDIVLNKPKTMSITYGMAVPAGYVAVSRDGEVVTCVQSAGTVEFTVGKGKATPSDSVPVAGNVFTLSYANPVKSISVPTLSKVTVTEKVVVKSTGQVVDVNSVSALPGQQISLPKAVIPKGYEVIGTMPTSPTTAPNTSQTITVYIKDATPAPKPVPVDTTPTSVKVTVIQKSTTGEILSTETSTVKVTPDMKLPTVNFKPGYTQVSETVNGITQTGNTFTLPKDASKGLTIVYTLKPPVIKPVPKEPATVNVSVKFKTADGKVVSSTSETVKNGKTIDIPEIHVPLGYNIMSKTINGVKEASNDISINSMLKSGINIVYTVVKEKPVITKGTSTTTNSVIAPPLIVNVINDASIPSSTTTKPSTTDSKISATKPSTTDSKTSTGDKTTDSKTSTGDKTTNVEPTTNKTTDTKSDSTSKETPKASTTDNKETPKASTTDNKETPKASTTGSKTSTSATKSTDSKTSTSATKSSDVKPSTTTKSSDVKPSTTGAKGTTKTSTTVSSNKTDSTHTITVEVYNVTTGKTISIQTLTGKEGADVIASPVAIPSGMTLEYITINGHKVALTTKVPTKFGGVNEKIIYNVTSQPQEQQPTIVPASNVSPVSSEVMKEIKAVHGTITRAPQFTNKIITLGSIVPNGYIPILKNGSKVTCESVDGTIIVTVPQGQKIPSTWKKVGLNSYEVQVTNQAKPITVEQDSSITVSVYKNGVKVSSTTYYGQVGSTTDIKVPNLSGYQVVNINDNGTTITKLPTKFGDVDQNITYNLADKTSTLTINIYDAAGKLIKTQQITGYVGSDVNISKLELPKGSVISTMIENGDHVTDLTFGTTNTTAKVYTINKNKAVYDTVHFVNQNGYEVSKELNIAGDPGTHLWLTDNMLPKGYVVTEILVNGLKVNTVPTEFGTTNENIVIMMKKLPTGETSKETSSTQPTSKSSDKSTTSSSTSSVPSNTGSTTTGTTKVINNPTKVVNEPAQVINKVTRVQAPQEGSYNPGNTQPTQPISVANPLPNMPQSVGSRVQTLSHTGLPTNGNSNLPIDGVAALGIAAGMFALIETIRRRK